MTTQPAPHAPEQEAIDRLKRRAWQDYLEATRDSEQYETAEQDAWQRLQGRLGDIDAELLLAHSTDS